MKNIESDKLLGSIKLFIYLIGPLMITNEKSPLKQMFRNILFLVDYKVPIHRKGDLKKIHEPLELKS